MLSFGMVDGARILNGVQILNGQPYVYAWVVLSKFFEIFMILSGFQMVRLSDDRDCSIAI